MPRAFLASEGIADVTGLLSRTAKDLAPALSKFLERAEQRKPSTSTAQALIYRWRRDLLQRRKTLKEGLLEGLDPAFEIFNEEVRSFFADEKITKPQDLLGCRGLGHLWMAWRQETSFTGVNESTANNDAVNWRQSVKEQVAAGAVTATASNPNALDFDELARLGPMPRAFLASEGIKHVQDFLSRTLKDLALALVKFMRDNKQKELSPGTTKKWIACWRRDLLQRRETLKEGVQGPDPTFEVFDATVRSFFADTSIVDAQGLLTYGTKTLFMTG